jgi:hypothetical protein
MSFMVYSPNSFGNFAIMYIVEFLVKVAIAPVCLWLAMKLTKEGGPFLSLLAAVFIAALVGLIPYVGGYLSFVVLIVLISRWTTAEIWPDAVLMVVVAWGLAVIASFALAAALASLG